MLPPTLIKTAWRMLLRRRLQSALMLLGVALGVAMVVSIDLANASARRAFRLSTEAALGRATHVLRGGPGGIAEDLYRRMRVEWGVAASAPVVEGLAVALDSGQALLRVRGVDLFAEGPFRDHLDAVLSLEGGLEAFFLDPRAVLVDRSLADRFGLSPGDTLRVQVNQSLVDLWILGILEPASGEARGLDDVLLMDLAAAQELTGSIGRLTRIDLILDARQAEALRARLPAGVQLQPASQQRETADQLSAAFQLNLFALSLLALLVGTFLIYNSMMFSVVQRREVFGTLRVLGASPAQLFGVILLEAAFIGALGSALGLAFGLLMGRGAVELVSATINNLYFSVAVQDVNLDPTTAAKGLLLGLLATLLSAVPPALEAARATPITAMQRSSLERGFRRLVPWMTLLGAASVALNALGLLLITDNLAVNLALFLALVLGLASLVPGAILLLMRVAAPLLRHVAGNQGAMAARTVSHSLSRTAVAIAALMVALSVAIGVSVMIDSFRDTVENWLDLTLQADLYIAPPNFSGPRPSARLSKALARQLEEVAGVEAVETFHAVRVDGPDGPVLLSVAEIRRRRDARLYRLALGDPQRVWDALEEGAVMVSESFAYRHGIRTLKPTVRLFTDRGWQEFPLAAIYYDYATDQGTVFMADATYRRYWDDAAISSMGVYLEPGADLVAVQGALRRALQGTGLEVQANRALREEALAIFDRTFAVTNALRLLAVVVALIGVLSALLALQLERRRELATLQALGLTDGGLWRLSLMETGLMGLAAGLLSWPTGLALAAVLIYVINLRSFGWSLQMSLSPEILAQALLVGVLGSLLAAVYPTRRLLAEPIAAALRGE